MHRLARHHRPEFVALRLAELQSHNAAAGRSSTLALASALLSGLATVIITAAPPGAAAAAMCMALGASLAAVAAGCASAATLASGRTLALWAEQLEAALPSGHEPGSAGHSLRLRAAARAGWQQVAVGGIVAGCAASAAAFACAYAPVWHRSPQEAAVGAGVLLVLAFALLVAERHLSAVEPDSLPEAPALAALARVPVAVAVVCGLGCLLLYAGVSAGAYAGRVSAALCLLVAGEMTLRAFAALFVPFPPAAEARMAAASTIAGALALRRPPPVTAVVRDLFGIDLSRSWALAFMRAAAPPVLAMLGLFGWTLSGVEALHVDQRAIYERFGKPVAVFGPGLHVRLPWPVGRLRPVELGVMHDVPIVFDAPGDTAPTQARVLPGAEDDPGPDADRLWDGTHPSEGAYLVASLVRGEQSFESLDIDLRVTWRVGMTDTAALQAAYATSDPQRLVQARTSRLLAHYFAHHTLPGMLGADRAGFSRDVAADLQAELDASQAGLEVMAVVVEAIHPPPGAASAYQAVEAARIGAYTAIAEQRGMAAKTELGARRDATDVGALAEARAHDTLVDAQVHATGFAADRTADARNPKSFLLERKLAKLGDGLAHHQLLIVDHRLAGAGGPTLDMRPSGTGSLFVPPAHEPP